MKVNVMLLLGIVVLANLISAEVILNGESVQSEYAFGEILTGNFNVEFIEESFEEDLVSSSGEKISLGKFLEKNFASYTCSSENCQKSYVPGEEIASEELNIIEGEQIHAGFVISGQNIKIVSMDFDLESDFSTSLNAPLTLKFFEDELWNFNEFSNEYSSKFGGCYNPATALEGPFIRTLSYCELIPLSQTGAVRLEAEVSGQDSEDLIMDFYEESGSQRGSCTYTSSEGSCVVESEDGDIFEGGTYQVCVRAKNPTNYKLYTESAGINCGFIFSNGPLNSLADYSIFARTAKYADATTLNSDSIDFEEVALAADRFIAERYNRDCTSGCALPIEFTGINQSLKVRNITISYIDAIGELPGQGLYNMSSVAPTVNFSGALDIIHADFNVEKAGIFSVFLGKKKVFDKSVIISSIPLITSVSPLNPPAGIPINFIANIDYSGLPTSFDYLWDFGDGQTKTTSTNQVSHTYDLVKDYVMKVTVTAGGVSSPEKIFQITSLNPLNALSLNLEEKRASLNNLEATVQNIPSWIKFPIESSLKLAAQESQISLLEKELAIATNTSNLSEVAGKIYAVNIPIKIESLADTSILLASNSFEINPSPIITLENLNGGSLEEYKASILNWQSSRAIARISSQNYYSVFSEGEKDLLITSYTLNVRSLDPIEESFVAINIPLDEITFKDPVDPIDSRGYTLISLGPNDQRVIEFYTSSSIEPVFFMSPSLKSIVVSGNIDESCNFNLVCEPGESSATCRSDCKPTKLAGFYLFAAVLFLLVFYTTLQVWYKRNYESYLFGDNRHLYNTLMYVTNAQARGVSDNQIKKDLEKSGWSSERIRYVVRKSHGQSNGLYEIIPVDKLMSIFRKKKAKKNIENAENANRPPEPRERPVMPRKTFPRPFKGFRQNPGRY